MIPIKVYLNSQQAAYLDALVRTGLYGSSRSEVGASLVATGVANAILSGIIKIRRRR